MNTKLSERFSHIYYSNTLLWIIICVGIILRLIRYLDNPSLYFDESVYAVDLIKRSFSELNFPASDWSSITPYGFLILEKLSVLTFGSTEYALRLIPFLFSLLSLVLFYYVGKYFIKPKALPVALALFAILDHLVYYATLLKSYSVDLSLTLLLFVITIHIQSKKTTAFPFFLFAVVGAIVIWLSNPILFVLAGLGTSLALLSLKEKEWSGLGRLSIVFSIWTLSYAVLYFVYTRNTMESLGLSVDYLLKMEKAYMPIPPKSFADVKWYIETFFATFDLREPLDPTRGVTLIGIAALAFIAGCLSMFSENKERFFILISPVLFTLFASALHLYPFKGRLILFLVPLLLLIIAEGVLQIKDKLSNKSSIIGIIFIGMLFVYPLSSAVNHAIKPLARSGMRSVLTDIKNNWQNGDILYVHYYAQHEFEYYSKYYQMPYSFDQGEYVIGIAPRGWYRFWKKNDISKYYDTRQTITQTNIDIFKEYVKDINKLKGHKRVWVLFSDTIPRGGMREEQFFLFHLESIGKKLDSFGESGLTVVYLYDLSGRSKSEN